MAFGAPGGAFAASGGGSALSGGSINIQKGADLLEIQTEAIGFHALAGESKLRLLSTPWPENALPAPSSSLFSIASDKGLLAAVGPDQLVVASTDSVRSAFTSGGDEVKSFTPQLSIPMETRISQLTFTSDGELLVISAEAGGGLAFYETQSLINGNTKSVFELATGGKAVRALAPNPAPESAGLLAIVTTDGQLMMVDIKNRTFISGSSGQCLREGVSCVSWSNKGKQLVAGLGNGAAHQMTPDGVGKAEIPRPPGLEGDQHVSSITWLENDLFLTVHTPTSSDDSGMASPSTYHIIRREKNTTNFLTQLLPEVCGPFGLNRSPSYQFIQRLREFPPSLKDVIVVASTSSEDVGLFTRSSTPLSSDVPADQVVDIFTTTSMANDSRRAALPMGADMTTNTSVIGLCMDLSSKETVSRPIPGDEIESSPGPVPAVLLLNHEGVLSGWWIIYSDSIRQGTTYPGLTVSGAGQKAPAIATSTPAAFGSSAQQPSNQSAFGQSSTMGAAPPAFGSPSQPGKPAFGGTAFGAPAALGGKPSPWATPASGSSTAAAPAFGQPAFGKPAFGSPSTMGTAAQTPAFGSSGAIGARASPWGTSTQSPSTSGAAFGQASTLGAKSASPFATAGSGSQASSFAAPTTGGFASFANPANSAGFAAAASAGGDALKQQTPTTSSFGGSKESGSLFGGQKNDTGSSGLFGTPKAGFTLDSSWTNPNPEKANENKAPVSTGGSLFGTNFASALNQPSQEAPITKEADMMSDDEETTAKSPEPPKTSQTTTPQQTPSLFGAAKSSTTPGGLFGQTSSKQVSSPLKEQVQPPITLSQNEKKQESSTSAPPPAIKSEAVDEDQGVDQNLQEPPLPPDPMSKTSYTPGNSSASSMGASVSASKSSLEEPPLPPDPFQQKSSTATPTASSSKPDQPILEPASTKAIPTPPPKQSAVEQSSPAKQPEVEQPSPAKESNGQQALPESDEEDLDEEGSGVDVAEEMTSGAEQTPDLSPESSFLKPSGSSIGGSFEKVSPQRDASSRSLFGEVGNSPIPKLNPTQRVQQSPRSPSPVRLGARSALRNEASRSVSAPGVPLRMDGTRKVTIGRPVEPSSVYPPAFSEQAQREERERLAKQKAQRQAEEEQELSDREDEELRELLASEVQPTLTLDPFTAHVDYVEPVSKQGIPGQIERVYRDINSMVDTLGLNSRSVAAFIKGQEELGSNQGRSREDLEREQAWTLAEIEDLGAVVDALEGDLADGKLEEPKVMIAQCQDFLRELSRMKAKSNDIKQSINAKQDPQLLESLRTAPLTTEQSTIRHDLRGKYTEFQRSLAQTEEAISMLKAKLANLQAMSSKANGASKVPTVEAVEKTILKMTGMFEKKSGDIDLLETQLRKLNLFGSPAGSREGSPFVTPPQKRIGVAPVTPGSSVNGRSFYTPGSRGSGLAASAGASSRRHRTPGKKMMTVADTEAQAYAAKAARKRQVRVLLKEALTSGEPRIRTLDDL